MNREEALARFVLQLLGCTTIFTAGIITSDYILFTVGIAGLWFIMANALSVEVELK